MARHHSRRLAVPLVENVAVMPTPERRNHGVVERLERPIADEFGSSRATLSRRRHARRNGAPRFDHREHAPGG